MGRVVEYTKATHYQQGLEGILVKINLRPLLSSQMARRSTVNREMCRFDPYLSSKDN